MKDTIIKLNDTFAGILIVAMTIFGIVAGSTKGDLWFFLGGAGGFIAGALVCGVWFVLSSIREELIEANRQLKHLRTNGDNVHGEIKLLGKALAPVSVAAPVSEVKN